MHKADFSERQETEFVDGNTFNYAQRQHIFTIKKSTLKPEEFKEIIEMEPNLIGIKRPD